MAGSIEVFLLGDIGATNARFALLSEGAVGPITRIEVARYAHFADAVADLLDQQFRDACISRALIAVAGPVEGDRCALTNLSWVIDARDICERFNFASARIVNDFEAAAHSLPHLGKEDVRSLGTKGLRLSAPMAVLGPGSGLGVAGLVPDRGRWLVVPSEGGHATLSANSNREDMVLDYLRQRYTHVSAERVLSGPGLENLYDAIAGVDDIDAPRRNASEITRSALEGTCPTARAALDMFCAMLGGFAGNVALTFGAQGGIYIAGGIAPRIVDCLIASQFRSRFEQKGRFCRYLESVPTQVIMHPWATFLGLRSIVVSDPLMKAALQTPSA
ncbi:MAG: glucokinase [Alphaproteobacteria bacterium]|nr:glucokinase [Alphaproteobacteria bacterium]